MIIINNSLLDTLSVRAETAPRKRMNHNFHQQLDDPLQRMLNALEPGTYIRPHKHENPDKYESFLVLRGQALIIEFDDHGNITSHSLLDPSVGYYGAEIAPRIYHTIISLQQGTIVYEAKQGPYLQLSDKNFAPWAPPEGSDEVTAFLEQLIQKCQHS